MKFIARHPSLRPLDDGAERDAMTVILTTEEQRDLWMRSPWDEGQRVAKAIA